MKYYIVKYNANLNVEIVLSTERFNILKSKHEDLTYRSYKNKSELYKDFNKIKTNMQNQLDTVVLKQSAISYQNMPRFNNQVMPIPFVSNPVKIFADSLTTSIYTKNINSIGVLIHGIDYQYASKLYSDLDKNTAELSAVYFALLYMKKANVDCIIYSSSCYALYPLLYGWIYEWASFNWILDNKPIKNYKLWISILELIKDSTVEFKLIAKDNVMLDIVKKINENTLIDEIKLNYTKVYQKSFINRLKKTDIDKKIENMKEYYKNNKELNR